MCTEFAIDPDDGRASPTIEELLAELGPEEQYTIDDKDLVEVRHIRNFLTRSTYLHVYFDRGSGDNGCTCRLKAHSVDTLSS